MEATVELLLGILELVGDVFCPSSFGRFDFDIGGFIGCLGGSVLYALTGGRLDLENNDWRALLMGLLIVGSAIVGFAALLWWFLR